MKACFRFEGLPEEGGGFGATSGMKVSSDDGEGVT